LANNLGAKNHAVEVDGLHRSLVALVRDLKENQCRKQVKTVVVVKNGQDYSSFSRLRGEVKRIHRPLKRHGSLA
jgi:hypothetical protein